MKRITYLIAFFISVFSYAQVQQANFSVNPTDFRIDEEITITISNVDPTLWNAGQSDNVYMWAWYFDLDRAQAGNSPTNGDWTNSNEFQKLTNNGNSTYSYTFTPSTLFGTTNISKIGFLVKAKNGDGSKQSQDMFLNPVLNELTRTMPIEHLSVVDSNTSLNISATTTQTSNFTLKANGSTIDTANGITNYSFNYAINEDINFVLEANDGHTTISEEFLARLTPTNPVPSGMLDGLNIDINDASKATLVLYAPNKTTVHVIGDFNNWLTDSNYLMKKDTARDKFWIELTGLSAGNHTYQYLVDTSIKVADPFSTVILDENDDSSINSTTYPNLPPYPAGQTTNAVSLFNTNSPTYNWQVTNFQKPEKTDLVIYELLIRDFDTPHSFDSVKTRLDHLESLGINAIELMPVSEFDGNKSWGYNPSFHMALDKYYGTATAFKELIDECHNRGIAVILDVVYNHGTGQHPFYRLWNTSSGGTGGQASNDNPFFNATAKHAFNVFNDFNHQSYATQEYVERTVKYWIEEYKIDGFRWDLTKGFTQNCTDSDGSCTDSYQQDRVDILKKYADYQWEVDPDFYVIFEHLGGIDEEKSWADYRINEGKGIMLWNKLTGNYNESTLGYHDNGKSDFSNVYYANKGFDTPSAVSYMESHDEERLMYKNLEFGNSDGGYSVKTPNTALSRMEIAGAFFFTVPGPKMIWQFGELGYEKSIFSCTDGTIPQPYASNESCKLSDKPNGWAFTANSNRMAIYNTWSRLIDLKLREPIFSTDNITMDLGKSDGLKSVHLTLSSASGSEIKHIVILGNFGVTQQSIDTNFQITGTWYNLMDESNTPATIDGSTTSISLAPGEFKIYGDKTSTLSVNSVTSKLDVRLFPNPTKDTFSLNQNINKIDILDITGKLVKAFKGNFKKGQSFDISNLKQSLYLVKATNNLGEVSTIKIIKI